MGIIINSDYVLPNGITVNNVYASFKDSQITLDKMYFENNENNENNYNLVLKSYYYIYSSKDFRLNYKPHIKVHYIDAVITKEDLSKNPYTILYEKLKEIYVNYTDDI